MSSAFDPAALSQEPIDEAAVQTLRRLLAEQAVPAGGMALEMVDGLFSALLVAPVNTPAEQFLPLVLGSAANDAAVRAALEPLLARLWNHVAARIEIDPDADSGTFMPLLNLPRELPEDPTAFSEMIKHFDVPLGAAWAGGFLHAVGLHLDAWRQLEAAIPGSETTFGYLLQLVQIEAGEDGSPAPTAAERVGMMAAMPYFLRVLAAQRRARA